MEAYVINYIKCPNGVTLKQPEIGTTIQTEHGPAKVRRNFDFASTARERSEEELKAITERTEFYLGSTEFFFDVQVQSTTDPEDIWYMDWMEVQEALKHPWHLIANPDEVDRIKGRLAVAKACLEADPSDVWEALKVISGIVQ